MYLICLQNHKGPVSSVQFNWNDTYVASGSEKGEIILYNVATGMDFAPMITPRVQVGSTYLSFNCTCNYFIFKS